MMTEEEATTEQVPEPAEKEQEETHHVD